MPTPVKYFNPELKEAYKNVEYIANQKIVSMLPEDFKGIYENIFFHNESEEWAIVKAADKLAAYIKCIEEEKAGNKEFVKARETIAKAIDAIDRPEVKYFMDVFMKSFSLTLDELDINIFRVLHFVCRYILQYFSFQLPQKFFPFRIYIDK